MYYKLIRSEPVGKAVYGKLYRSSHYYNKRLDKLVERLHYVCDTLENADYLVRSGMAVRIEKNNHCTETITELMSKPEKLAQMRECIQRSSCGNSSERIYELMQELIQKYSKKE